MEISVIVADDSAFLRKIISDILAENKSIKIIDRARNGREAVEKVLDLAPDVLLLDLIMPEMDGMEALKIIMREFPTPTIILSALSPENIDASVQALLIGAFDYIIKPGGLGAKDLPEFKEDLLSKVLLASKSLIKKHSEPHQYLLDRNVSLRQEVINKIFKFGELLKEVKPLNKNDKYIEGPLFESKNLEEKILKKINIQEIPETIEKINDLQVNKKKVYGNIKS